MVPPSSKGKPNACRSANQASATLRARVRMRPIVAVLSVTEITPRASSRLKVWLHLSTKSSAGAGRFFNQITGRLIDFKQLLEASWI